MERRLVDSIRLVDAISLVPLALPILRLKLDVQGIDFRAVRSVPGDILRRRVVFLDVEVKKDKCKSLYEQQESCSIVMAYMAAIGFQHVLPGANGSSRALTRGCLHLPWDNLCEANARFLNMAQREAFGCESEEETLLRYLRSRKGDVTQAADSYYATSKWREDSEVAALRRMAPSEALGCDVSVLRSVLPHAQRGVDRAGGPLIFKHMGQQCKFRDAVSAGATLDGMARYNVWLNETYMDALGEAGAREWSVIIDAAGWYPGLFDRYGYHFIKTTATTDSTHYPELLHSMIVVNAPPMLAFTWRIIRSWLDAETAAKIDILSEKQPQHARERLLKLVEPSQLPQQYGGTAPPLPEWPERSGVVRSRSK